MQAIYEKVATPADSSYRCFVREDERFEFNWHFHREYELTLIVRSRGKRFVGDDIAEYADGDLVLLGSNLPHTWASEIDAPNTGKPHRAVVVQFTTDFLGREFFHKPELQAVNHLLDRARRGLQVHGTTRDEVAPLVIAMETMQGLPRLIALMRVLDRLANADAGEFRPLSSPEFVPSLRKMDQQRIDTVCQHIHARSISAISLSEIAAMVHMSPSTFSRFFKRTMGRTFVEYLTELRIGRACSMLMHTDRSVTEVCFESGFNNLAHFNRKFLELKKVTPRQFRKSFTGTHARDDR